MAGDKGHYQLQGQQPHNHQHWCHVNRGAKLLPCLLWCLKTNFGHAIPTCHQHQPTHRAGCDMRQIPRSVDPRKAASPAKGPGKVLKHVLTSFQSLPTSSTYPLHKPSSIPASRYPPPSSSKKASQDWPPSFQASYRAVCLHYTGQMHRENLTLKSGADLFLCPSMATRWRNFTHSIFWESLSLTGNLDRQHHGCCKETLANFTSWGFSKKHTTLTGLM